MKEIVKKCAAAILAVIICFVFSQPTYADIKTRYYKDFGYEIINGQVYILSYEGTKSTITLPDEINGRKVVAVTGMEKSPSVRTVILSKNITKCQLMFATQIKNIKVAKGNPYLTVYNNCVISHYTNIIDAPGGIKQVNGMPDSVTKVSIAFTGPNLESVTLGKNVRKLLMSFHNCKNLKTVNLNANLRRIGYQSFFGCTSLKTIRLGKNVSSIDEKAFSASGLKKIVIKNPYCYIANSSIPSQTVIYGYKNSTAQEYARVNGNVFVKLD